jgi:hypothetical protein
VPFVKGETLKYWAQESIKTLQQGADLQPQEMKPLADDSLKYKCLTLVEEYFKISQNL